MYDNKYRSTIKQFPETDFPTEKKWINYCRRASDSWKYRGAVLSGIDVPILFDVHIKQSI